MALQFRILIIGISLMMMMGIGFSGDIGKNCGISWGNGRAKMHDNGKLLTLSMDKESGSGFQSKHEYLFGKFEVKIKLVEGNSAGTVTTFYLSSQGPTHDEIDFEFLGNLSGDPYTLHTNVFANGVGGREMQFKLWFDPTKDFHTYSIVWNPRHVILMVDGFAIRDFKNMESRGFAFPTKQPMRVYASLWDGEDWATRGGTVKTNWTESPFVASYKEYSAHACIPSKSNCDSSSRPTEHGSDWWDQELDSTSQEIMMWVQKNYMTYNYCNDHKRFPEGFPQECYI